MLKRKAIQLLFEYKDKKGKKPLIVQGAGQVGKTYAVLAFAKQAYKAVYYINFFENSGLKALFGSDLNADRLLSGIRLSFPGMHYVPGNTLIFIDEIQECPQAVTALKFLANDPRFDVITSGSALGLLHGSVTSWPVGQVEYLDMYALDFEEFLWARGIDAEITSGLNAYSSGTQKIPEAIHNTLMKYLREYLIVGGMPDVVNAFAEGEDYLAADAVQKRICRDYEADIAHYAEPENRIKAQACWRSIPAQLLKDNHKFMYETVEHRGTARKFGTSVDWLSASQMVCRIENVTMPEYPLEAYAVPEQFRLYPGDIGLLIGRYDVAIKKALLLEDDSSVVLRTAKGGIYEALAADMLHKRGLKDIHYYKNTTGTIEIEFLLESADGIIPVEIKAGHNRARSLDKLLESPDIIRGYKFSGQNAGTDGKRITLPLYLLPFVDF